MEPPRRSGPRVPRNSAFLSSIWWDKVVEAWNNSHQRGALAGLGLLCFEVLDGDYESACIEWDSVGYARRLLPWSTPCSTLSATVSNWWDFVSGRFSATMGVLQGRLQFRGEMTQILPYSAAFNRLAEVARTVGDANDWKFE